MYIPHYIGILARRRGPVQSGKIPRWEKWVLLLCLMMCIVVGIAALLIGMPTFKVW